VINDDPAQVFDGGFQNPRSESRRRDSYIVHDAKITSATLKSIVGWMISMCALLLLTCNVVTLSNFIAGEEKSRLGCESMNREAFPNCGIPHPFCLHYKAIVQSGQEFDDQYITVFSSRYHRSAL